MTEPSRVHWMTAYEDAYAAANGHPAKVVIYGNGWYSIDSGNCISGTRYRKAEIVAMTARLEQRAEQG